jgi:hypothetical protein
MMYLELGYHNQLSQMAEIGFLVAVQVVFPSKCSWHGGQVAVQWNLGHSLPFLVIGHDLAILLAILLGFLLGILLGFPLGILLGFLLGSLLEILLVTVILPVDLHVKLSFLLVVFVLSQWLLEDVVGSVCDAG